MSDRILIIDAAPLAYSVFNTVGHLSWQGEPTGLRYGFIRGVRSYQEKTASDKVVIAWDSPGPPVKAQGFTNYKSNRIFTDAKAEMYAQVPAVKDMLKFTKWTQVEAPGYEADDLIGALARAKSQRNNQVTLVSPDNDLLQLVNANTEVFRPGSAKKKTKDRLITDRDVFAIYGVHPEYLCMYRAITGDVSDNIPGILTRGSEKQELADLFHFMGRRTLPLDPDEFDAALDRTDRSSQLRTLRGSTTVRDNFKLMSLPTPTQIDVTKGTRDKAGLDALFNKLGFKSMARYLDELTGSAQPVAA